VHLLTDEVVVGRPPHVGTTTDRRQCACGSARPREAGERDRVRRLDTDSSWRTICSGGTFADLGFTLTRARRIRRRRSDGQQN